MYPGLLKTFYSALAADSAGNLYVSGVAQDDGSTNGLGGPAHWFVQRSTDGGATWDLVDDFVPGGDWWWRENTSLVVDAAGNVFFGMAANNGISSENTYWTIRRGIGGATFTTVDSLAYPNDDGPQEIYVHPTAGVFAVGYDHVTTVTTVNKKRITSSSSAWIVRRSLDGGTTWQTVNTYQLTSGRYASAAGISADASGNLYVVGSSTAGSYRHWIVRKSADGG